MTLLLPTYCRGQICFTDRGEPGGVAPACWRLLLFAILLSIGTRPKGSRRVLCRQTVEMETRTTFPHALASVATHQILALTKHQGSHRDDIQTDPLPTFWL